MHIFYYPLCYGDFALLLIISLISIGIIDQAGGCMLRCARCGVSTRLHLSAVAPLRIISNDGGAIKQSMIHLAFLLTYDTKI